MLQETDVSWDLVLVLDVFEHVDDYLGFLRGLSRIARNIIFHIPLDISVMRVLASALIDRLLHHCHIVNIRVNSYRMRHHRELWQTLNQPDQDASPPPRRRKARKEAPTT